MTTHTTCKSASVKRSREYISRKGKNGWTIVRNPRTPYELVVRVVNTRAEATEICRIKNLVKQ